MKEPVNPRVCGIGFALIWREGLFGWSWLFSMG
jgi:hypothetical protein